MSAARDLRPTHCRPHGAGFVLDVLYLDAKAQPAGRIAVSSAELLDWAIMAAGYDGMFRHSLQQHLAKLDATTPKGDSDATRQA